MREANPAGEADVVAAGPNNTLMYYATSPPTSEAFYPTPVAGPGTPLPGIFSPPAIAVRSNGEVDAVAMGENNSLVYYWAFPGTVWSYVQIAGPGTTFSPPAIAVREADLEAEIVAMGPNNTLLYYHATPGQPWGLTTIAGPETTFNPPAIAVSSSGVLGVVALGPGTYVYIYYWATPPYTNWQSANVN